MNCTFKTLAAVGVLVMFVPSNSWAQEERGGGGFWRWNPFAGFGHDSRRERESQPVKVKIRNQATERDAAPPADDRPEWERNVPRREAGNTPTRKAPPGWEHSPIYNQKVAAADDGNRKRPEVKKVTVVAPPPPPRQKPTRFESLGSKDYVAITKKIGDPNAPNRKKVLFLHGAGQNTDNDLFRRFAASLEGKGLNADVIAVPYEDRDSNASGDLKELIRGAGFKSLIIAGHSAGGAQAADLIKQFPNKVEAAVLINPVVAAGNMPVPTLFLRGQADNGDPVPEYMRTVGRQFDNLVYFPVIGGDHSNRYRPEELRGDWIDDPVKEELSSSKATHTLNSRIARTMVAFLNGATSTPDIRAGERMAKQVSRKAHDAKIRALFRQVKAIPRDARSAALETLALNREAMAEIQAMKPEEVKAKYGAKFEVNDDDHHFLYGFRRPAALKPEAVVEKVIGEQTLANRKALEKLLTMQDRPPTHLFTTRVVNVPEAGSARKAAVILTAQPKKENLKNVVRQLKEKGYEPDEIAVVNLRAENNQEAEWINKDKAFDGVRAIHVGYLDHSIPSFDQVRAALAPMNDPKIKIVIVHCHKGKGRTGTMLAAARMVLDGWSTDKALKEAKDEGLSRPVQLHFIEQLGKAVERGEFKL